MRRTPDHNLFLRQIFFLKTYHSSKLELGNRSNQIIIATAIIENISLGASPVCKTRAAHEERYNLIVVQFVKAI